nr:hypothetical protein [uncultured Desulfobulbus sp.]
MVLGQTHDLAAAITAQKTEAVEWRDYSAIGGTVSIQLLAISYGKKQRQVKGIDGKSMMEGPLLSGYLKRAESKWPGTTFYIHTGNSNSTMHPAASAMGAESEFDFFTLLGNNHCRPDGLYDRECNIISTPDTHEFTLGVKEMLGLANKGQPEAGSYQRPAFPHICANLVESATNQPLFPPYVVRMVDGVPIGFIGALMQSPQSRLVPENVKELEIRDPAQSVNQYVNVLQGQGVHTIVVMLQQGEGENSKTSASNTKNLTDCPADFFSSLDDEVDVILCSRSQGYENTLVKNKGGREMLLVRGWTEEKGLAKIQLEISRASAEVVAMRSSISSSRSAGIGEMETGANVARINAEMEKLRRAATREPLPRLAEPAAEKPM